MKNLLQFTLITIILFFCEPILSQSYNITMDEPSTNITLCQDDINFFITWNASGPSGSTIWLRRDLDNIWDNGNETWIATSQANDGSYSWNLANVPLGTYYIAGMIADANGYAYDYASGKITIGEADLIVINPSGPSSSTPGGSIQISCTVKNVGTCDAPSSILGYYLASTPTGTTRTLGTDNVSSLDPGQSSNESETVTIPTDITPGDYYIVFNSDIEFDVEESNENNNTNNVPITISQSYDITMIEPSTNINLCQGDFFFITWDATGPSGSVINLRRDVDNIWENGNETWIALTLANNGSYSWHTDNVPLGTYYIAGMISDGNGYAYDYASGTITVNAPIVAQFTGTPTSGCSPLTVQFNSSQSTGNITSYSWNFGDGGTSTQQNPSHTYNTPGNYTVILTVSGSCGSDVETKTNYITVNSSVVAQFIGSPTSGCSPLNVQFNSSQSTGNITSYSWNFGDGGTSTQQNPSHTYNSPGIYTVSLTVTGSCGSDVETKTNYITVNPAPVAQFTGTPTSGCSPLTVQFNSSQSTGNITSYSWNFGDGGTSTQQNPSHTYNSPGIYTVSLTVTGSCGSDVETKTNYITVNPAPVAQFTGTPTSGCSPLTVQFNSSSSTGNITSYSWNFGDGGTSTQQNPSHTYNSPGTYTVSLTVTGPCGSDGETKSNYIIVNASLVAQFTGSPTSGCAPLSVLFTNQTPGIITNYLWNFGDGGTSNQQNPSHTYNSPGTYTVSLTVTGSCGSDVETKSNYIIVNASLVAQFTGSPTSGCAPLTVQFTNQTPGIITNYLWNFGDGGTSTQQNPSHTYNSPGIYTVSFTVTGSCGSDTETKSNYITVYEVPIAQFTGSPTQGAAPLSVQFNSQSTGNITNYSWNFGDGGTSNQQNPIHIYNSIGVYTVSLTITGFGGCSDTETKSNYITTKPTLSISPDNQTVSSDTGSFNVDVNSNISWIVSVNSDWLSVNPNGGSGDGSFIVSYQANQTTSSRSDIIIVSGGNIIDSLIIEQEPPLGVEDLTSLQGIVTEYFIVDNYPNPFNPSTSIEFGIPEESVNTLKVYDITGSLVQILLEEETLPMGRFKYEFTADNLPSGIYIYVLTSSSVVSNKSYNSVKKMILLK